MQPPLPPGNGTDNGTVIGALGIEIGAASDLLTAAKLVLPRPSHGHANRTTNFACYARNGAFEVHLLFAGHLAA